MECPSCGLDVLVQNGAITAHLRPDNLEPCDGKAKPSESSERAVEAPKAEAHDAPAKKAPAKKAPAKAAPKKAAH